MSVIKATNSTIKPSTKLTPFSAYRLIDTHTHFDAPVFDSDRLQQAQQAYNYGVRHLVLVGYLFRHFDRLYATQKALKLNESKSILDIKLETSTELYPTAHIALGLHPFYIEQHTEQHLLQMAEMLNKERPLAIGEIGLDTFTTAQKSPENLAKQQRFFVAQLDMAVHHQLPVMLHIRKAHAETLALLKKHDYDAHKLGGIAHSFSGGSQEAKAFVKLGFKLGVTGQVTNPNAKKLRRALQAAVDEFGIECLVIETDCPDMTPINAQTATNNPAPQINTTSPQSLDSQNLEHQTLPSQNLPSETLKPRTLKPQCLNDKSSKDKSLDNKSSEHNNLADEWQRVEGDNASHDRNVPANLPWVVHGLSELLAVDPEQLAQQLWQNSCDALQTNWTS